MPQEVIRKGRTYYYKPCGWDVADPKTALRPGDLVRVCHPHGCPKPGTMGHCHVETLAGAFLGLVACGSLVPWRKNEPTDELGRLAAAHALPPEKVLGLALAYLKDEGLLKKFPAFVASNV
jgi:hypothetical protein